VTSGCWCRVATVTTAACLGFLTDCLCLFAHTRSLSGQTWAAFDIFIGKPLVSALLTYLFWRALKTLREHLGQKNTGKKTLIDSRFLF
jgi:hypothetical protein